MESRSYTCVQPRPSDPRRMPELFITLCQEIKLEFEHPLDGSQPRVCD